MVAGHSYAVSVQMRNDGTNTWTVAESYRLGSQNPADNSTWGLARISVPTNIASGQTATFSFSVTAPATTGIYNFQWKMVRDGVTWFGALTPNVTVTVSAPPNVAPTVGITAPSSGQSYSTGSTVSITATAFDSDGTIQRVEFYVDGAKIGEDAASPYAQSWTSTQGNHSLTAKAVDNAGAVSTSASVDITVKTAPTLPEEPPPLPVNPTSRTDIITYEDNLSLWVIGQQKSSTNVETGLIESRTVYDPATALPIETYAFEKLQQRMTYDTTSAVSTAQRGTLKTVSDGRDAGTYDTTVTLSNWKRGIPQTIQFADGTQKSAIVSDLGLITSVTDEIGASTCYQYDAMGRLTQVNYPLETTGACDMTGTSWNQSGAYFRPLTATDWKPAGVSTGQWHRAEWQGGYRKVTYFDALWRPVLTNEYDDSNTASTLRAVSASYDADGRVTFQSYPSSQGVPPQQGITTRYDALGRVTQTEQTSELGTLVTKIAYLTDFRTQVTNPRGKVTTTGYMTYDQPATDWPVAITHPEGTYTDIERDTFGKPKNLTRRDATGSPGNWQRRYFAYNTYQELCSRTEVETGTTAMGYDAAGNLAWSASGQAWAPGGPCAAATDAAVAARRVDRTYDPRNRLSTLTFPDGNGNQTWSYYSDGLPQQVTTNNAGVVATNTYTYNSRRLLAGETLSQPNWYTWSLGYGYNANGHLSTLVQPGSESISFAPNALGQPTQAVSSYANYATGVSYYPNGAMQQFTYGNGLVHTLTQNARQLPSRSQDAYNGVAVLDDGYDYDFNGNVAAISDALAGNRGNRTMTYDGLDRLTSTVSPMFGGTISYSYDALDNLQTLTALGRNLRYCYDTGFRLSFVRSGSTSCSDGSATTSLTYDMQGNLRTKNAVTYTFDYGNRLRSASGQESYRYDAQGRRILAWAQNQGNILSFYGQDGVLRYQHDERKNRISNYVYLNGSLVSTRETDIATMVHTIKYQHTDALGTPVAVTDASRNVIERSEYEPYGKVLNRPIHGGPGYTGHVEDAATGLTYMQQRYYDPVVGRFLSVDPVAANPNTGASFNRYNYAANNPYRFKDPDGRDCVSVNGTTTCTVPKTDSNKVPTTISFPTPAGVSGKQDRASPAYHRYGIGTKHDKSDKAVQQSMVNDPTPGRDKPATPTGTLNNATGEGGRGLLAKAGGLLGNNTDSPVKSYSATDNNGNTWVINVTQPGHGLHFGYVLRGSVDGTAVSIGEGWAVPQAVPGLSDYINSVWVGQNQQNIDDAK